MYIDDDAAIRPDDLDGDAADASDDADDSRDKEEWALAVGGGAATGAITGAALGGPPGAAAGAALGTARGVVAKKAIDKVREIRADRDDASADEHQPDPSRIDSRTVKTSDL